MQDRWGSGPVKAGDDLDRLVYLSNLIGQDPSLVQPGGGNTSIKLQDANPFGEREEVLFVKGTGSDLRTIDREGFTRLSTRRLVHLRKQRKMTDQAMMDFITACMLYPHRDPLPSLETPLHSVLRHRVIVHTHDVATMSLTNLREDAATAIIRELFQGDLVYVPYARPGFPLARAVIDLAPKIPPSAWGLALAHHGIVVWGQEVEECYRKILQCVTRVAEVLAEKKKKRPSFGPLRVPFAPLGALRQRAEVLLPVIRGFLGEVNRVILHWDGSERILEAIAGDRFESLSRIGVATPDHILWAGRRPLWLPIDFDRPGDEWVKSARAQLGKQKEEYLEYHQRHAGDGEEPLPDWAKVVLVPGLGCVTAFREKRSAKAVNLCYRAVIDTIDNAEALGGFRFLPEEEVFRFEHWPLERRKVEEERRWRRRIQLLPGTVVLILGGGSGIGEAAARRFAEQGAHVAVADLEEDRAREVAEGICGRYPDRAMAVPVDVRDEDAVAAAVRAVILNFGGIDTLFYTPGLAPGFVPIQEIKKDDLQSQLEVHYLGAILAIREVSRVMKRQDTGGSIICSVSKAALAPGKDAVAYGGSKAALQHALRVAALELGADGIRVNAINADQVETPLFLKFAEARARAQGRTLEEQLEKYRQRNALGTSLIPPEAVADLAVLLASDRFRYTTGDILTIDGGLPDAFPR